MLISDFTEHLRNIRHTFLLESRQLAKCSRPQTKTSLTLSWEFSITFTLLSEAVTSGPNSTHPAQQLEWSDNIWIFFKSPPAGAGGFDLLTPTTFDSKDVINKSFVDNLWAQRSNKVHICNDNDDIRTGTARPIVLWDHCASSPLSIRKTFPISAWRAFCSPSSTCSLHDSYAIWDHTELPSATDQSRWRTNWTWKS